MRGRAKLVGLAFGAFLALASPAWAQLAVLLPNGEQQFLDSNGAPLAAGSAGFYIPSTMTPKTVWADPAQATPLVNPVALDAAGRAIIYGSGQYREIVKDVNGATIWDQLTYGQGPFPVWGGTSTGTGNAPVVSAGNWVLQNGAQIAWRVGANNSGATSLTIGSNSYTLYKDGSTGAVALTGSELIVGNLALATYDSVLGGLHISSIPAAAKAIGTLGTLAAASTTDLGSIPSQNVSVTGTGVTISSFGSSASTASPLYLVSFTGASNTLTASGSLILPGGAPTTVLAGDSLWALYGGAGAWDVLEIMRQAAPQPPQGQLFGLTLSNDAGTPASVIDTGIGEAASSSSTPLLMTLASPFTKSIASGWSVGTGNGCLDTGAVANGTYHIFLIKRVDTGLVDELCSTNATSPTMPTNYTLSRRIGSIVRSAGSIVTFTQNGDQFLLTTMVQTTVPANMTTAQTVTLGGIPTGIIEQALVRYTLTANAGATSFVLITALVEADAGAAQGTSTLAAAATNLQSFQGPILTNTSAQIRFKSNNTVASSTEETYGWIDTRGRS